MAKKNKIKKAQDKANKATGQADELLQTKIRKNINKRVSKLLLEMEELVDGANGEYTPGEQALYGSVRHYLMTTRGEESGA